MSLDLAPRLAALAELLQARPAVIQALDLAGPGRLFVVGGIVRDILLARPLPLPPAKVDLDLAVAGGEALGLGQRLAAASGGRLVVLSEPDQTVRLVYPDLTLDLAGLRRPTLAGDLAARDFTVNALALDLADLLAGRAKLIDPTGGLADLAGRILRPAGAGVLAEDPLRVLRAFRLAAELAFHLPEPTLAEIASAAPGLASVAGERISSELLRLLACPRSARLVQLMADRSVLAQVFPELSPLAGLTQNRYHHLDGLAHTLAALAEVESLLAGPWPAWPGLAALRRDPARWPALKLALLCHDAGKPGRAKVRPDGGLAFPGHDKLGAELWLVAAERLRLSRSLTKAVERLIRAHMRPLSLLLAPEVTLRGLRRLVLAAGEHLQELGLLCLADSLASQGPDKDPRAEERLDRLWEKLIATQAALAEQAQAPLLLTGRELIAELGLRPGPLIGRLLDGIEEERLAGRVTDRAGALEWARVNARSR